MKHLLFAMLLIAACGRAEDHETAPVAPAAESDEAEVTAPLEGAEREIRVVRLDIEQRPYYTVYDLGLTAVIASPEFETHGWKLAYAIKEGSAPDTCNDGDFTGADYPPINVARVKPNTHYFILACPIHATRGEYGTPMAKEFNTGDLRASQ